MADGKTTTCKHCKRGFSIKNAQPIPTHDYIKETTSTIEYKPLEQRKTILLVDDDEPVRRLVADELSSALINVIIIPFYDGQHALEFVKAHTDEIDLIISCIRMPVLDGIELLKKCKELRPEMPFIIYTAFSYLNDFNWGADAYIVKSSDPSELLNTAYKLLNNKRIIIRNEI